MATQITPDYPLLTANRFLEMDFGEDKAELDNGVVRMMAGGSARLASAACLARTTSRSRSRRSTARRP